jgi:hypothetical protein
VKEKVSFSFLTGLLALTLITLVNCGTSPKEREDETPEDTPETPTQVLDGDWRITGYRDSGSKSETILEKSIPLSLKNTTVYLELEEGSFLGSYEIKDPQESIVSFSLLSPSQPQELGDSNEKFLENFLRDSIEKSSRYRLNGDRLTLISSQVSLYLEK